MELTQTSIITSPAIEGNVRLVGEVRYDDGGIPPEEYWFDVPEAIAHGLSGSGNPWLACLIPLAVTLGEPLRIAKPVDPTLFDNIRRLMQIWKKWYPHLHMVPIEAEVIAGAAQKKPGRTAAFFSGGVDSFFTALHHNANSDTPINDLLTIWGFDVSLDNPVAFQRVQDNARSAASELGLDIITVMTNLRQTRLNQLDFVYFSHGSLLAGIALALEERYKRVLISATYAFRELLPFGSHPDTDPLFSTGQTAIIHYGVEFDRIQKTRFVAQSEAALDHLRVCWRSPGGDNCGECNKCYRTMTTLELFNALHRCPTFPSNSVDVKKLEKRYLGDVTRHFSNVRALAIEKGRADIAMAIEYSLTYTERIDKWLRVADLVRLGKWIRQKPALRWWLRPVSFLVKKILKFTVDASF